MSHGLRNNLTNLGKDLMSNSNVHVILISSYDIQQHLPNLPNFLFIPFYEYHGIYWHLYENTEPADPTKISKRFLSLNKRADIYRQLLYYKFHHMGWIGDNIFSYVCEDQWQGTVLDPVQYRYLHSIAKTFADMQDIIATAPDRGMIIDHDPLLRRYQSNFNGADPTWLAEKSWYDQTFCSIVIETDAGDDQINLSEKAFRCIALQHPMMLFAAPGTTKFLGQIGLDVLFEPLGWHDEGSARLRNFFDKIESLAKLDMPELVSMRHGMQERLEHMRRAYSVLHGRMAGMEAMILDQITAKIESWQLD